MRISLLTVFLFSSVALAQKNVCDPNSPMMNALLTEGGLKKELENLGNQAVGHIGEQLFFSYRDQVGGTPTCKEIVDALSEAQFSQGVLLTDFNCGAGTFSFNVPGYIEGEHLATNPHTQHGVFGESYKSKGQMPVGKQLNYKLNGRVQQLRIEGEGKAYRYNDKGQIVDEIEYVKQGDKYKISCSKVDKRMNEKIWQLNHTLPTMKVFRQKGVCNAGCGPSVSAMVKKNLESLVAAQRSGIKVSRIERLPNTPCGKLEDQAKRDKCLPGDLLKQLNKCGVSLGTDMVDCSKKGCHFITAKHGYEGCLSNALISAYNQNHCTLPNGERPRLCQPNVPAADIPDAPGAGTAGR